MSIREALRGETRGRSGQKPGSRYNVTCSATQQQTSARRLTGDGRLRNGVLRLGPTRMGVAAGGQALTYQNTRGRLVLAT